MEIVEIELMAEGSFDDMDTVYDSKEIGFYVSAAERGFDGSCLTGIGLITAWLFSSEMIVIASIFYNAATDFVIVGASVPAGSGNLQIGTRRLRAGSYNFTVYRAGQPADNGKIIIR